MGKNEGHTTDIPLNFLNSLHWQLTKTERVENCAILGYYAVCSGNSLPTFRDNLQVPSSRAHYMLRNSPEEHSTPLLRGDLKLATKRVFLHRWAAQLSTLDKLRGSTNLASEL